MKVIRVFRKHDAWLCGYNGELKTIWIKSIKGNYIKHSHGWSDGDEFNKMAKQRLGKARLLFGSIYLGYDKNR